MLMCIQVGKELGVPATEIEDLPERWLYAVRIYWDWQRRESEMSRRKSSRQAKSSSGRKKTRGT